jgi:hypothetical protein
VYKYDLQIDDSFIVVKTLLQSSCRAVLLSSYSESKNPPDDMKRELKRGDFLNQNRILEKPLKKYIVLL